MTLGGDSLSRVAPRRWPVLVLALAGGLVPLVTGWLLLGRVPSVTPAQARTLLADPASRAVLVDVRPADEYRRQHLEGATSWPLAQIKATGDAAAIAPEFSGRKLLLICNSGINSALGARHLRSIGLDAHSVRGGLQEWITVAGLPCPAGAAIAGTRQADGTPLAFRESPRFEQWLAVVTGFVIKPVYMLAALLLTVWLRRAAGPDLVALRCAMLTFFLGEAACALNYLIYGEHSVLFEYLHSYGMVLAFAFTAYAILAGVDVRLLHYSDSKARCAAIGLCRACTKHERVACALRRLFLLAIPAMILLAWLPLAAPLRTTAYNTRIVGTLYTYSHAVIHQAYEIRVLPLVAMLLLAAAFLALLRERHPVTTSKLFFAAATGAIGFSFFRLILLSAFEHNQVYFATWEELTELLFMAAVAWTLFVFRRGLFAPTPAAQVESTARPGPSPDNPAAQPA